MEVRFQCSRDGISNELSARTREHTHGATHAHAYIIYIYILFFVSFDHYPTTARTNAIE